MPIIQIETTEAGEIEVLVWELTANIGYTNLGEIDIPCFLSMSKHFNTVNTEKDK
jgi:hypothetical protein